MEICFDKNLEICPICGDSDITYWKSKYKNSVEYNIFKCHNCTGGFMNPRIRQDILSAIYGKSGHGLQNPISYDEVVWKEKEFPNSTIDAERILSYVNSFMAGNFRENKKCPIKVLDVGSGYGFYSLYAVKYGFDVTSINPGEYENRICQELFKKNGLAANIQIGMFEDFIFKDEEFQLVILSQILEHIKEPYVMLKEISRILAPGGIIAIAVPNFNSIFVKLMNVKDNSCLWVPEHCNYFTEKSLQFMAERVNLKFLKGFHICKIPYYAISNRLKLTDVGLMRTFCNNILKFAQYLPCRIFEKLKRGNYINLFFLKNIS